MGFKNARLYADFKVLRWFSIQTCFKKLLANVYASFEHRTVILYYHIFQGFLPIQFYGAIV
jgi:hypothetical protein